MTLNTFIQLHFVEYKKRPKQVQISCNICTPDPGGVLLGIFDGGVPPASPNPDPISDQKMPFPTPVFRPDLARD